MTSIKEALERLLTSAKILQQNAEGCAANHYGADFQREGLPGWLRDTKADIDAAQSALASLSILATGLASDEAAIRADERERCARIADAESVYYRNLFVRGKSLRGAAYYVHDDTWRELQARECQSAVIAAAIRAGRGEG